jgi:hypothetical protein
MLLQGVAHVAQRNKFPFPLPDTRVDESKANTLWSMLIMPDRFSDSFLVSLVVYPQIANPNPIAIGSNIRNPKSI